MSARGLGFMAGRLVNGVVNEWIETKRQARAVGRVLLSAIGLVPLGYCLWQLANGKSMAAKPMWLLIAMGAVALFLIVLRHLGGGRGIAWGFWLWLLSVCWVVGIAASLFAILAILAALMGEPIDWMDIIVCLAIVGLAVPCEARLRLAEERKP